MVKTISEELEEYGIVGIEEPNVRVGIRNYIIHPSLTPQQRKARADEVKAAIAKFPRGALVKDSKNGRTGIVKYICPQHGRVKAYLRWGKHGGGAFRDVSELTLVE